MFRFNFIFISLLITCSGTIFAAPATVTGTFSNPQSQDGGVPFCSQFNASNTQIRYGDTISNNSGNDCSNTDAAFNAKSGLEYVGVDTDVSCDGAPKQLGQFTHHNNTIQTPDSYQIPPRITDTLATADLSIDITIQGTLFNFTTAVAEFTETPNNPSLYPTADFPNTPNGSCPFGNATGGCLDRTVVNNIASTTTIVVDGQSCDLTVFGFGSCTTPPTSINDLQTEFLTTEGVSTTSCLYAVLSSQVPVTLSHFDSSLSSDHVNIDWGTSSELFNVGFQLWGLDGSDGQWKKLHNWLVKSGNGNAIEPQNYRKRVKVPSSIDQLISVGISSVDSDGSEDYYGPFDLGKSYGDLDQMEPIAWDKVRSELDARMATAGYVKDRVNGYRKVSNDTSAQALSASSLETVVEFSGICRWVIPNYIE